MLLHVDSTRLENCSYKTCMYSKQLPQFWQWLQIWEYLEGPISSQALQH